jgi:hypothetical protein
VGSVTSLQQQAREIAERALAKTRTDDETALSLSEACAALQAHAEKAQQIRNGRELTLFEAYPERIGRLVDRLIEGNYRDTAATLAGFTARSVRGWMDAADKGDARYEPVAQVIRIAEALAESASVRNVRAAGKDPRFWAADMTYLERKYPDKWGRRNEDANTPRVIVQLGVSAGDVQVHIMAAPPSAPTAIASLIDGRQE